MYLRLFLLHSNAFNLFSPVFDDNKAVPTALVRQLTSVKDALLNLDAALRWLASPAVFVTLVPAKMRVETTTRRTTTMTPTTVVEQCRWQRLYLITYSSPFLVGIWVNAIWMLVSITNYNICYDRWLNHFPAAPHTTRARVQSTASRTYIPSWGGRMAEWFRALYFNAVTPASNPSLATSWCFSL